MPKKVNIRAEALRCLLITDPWQKSAETQAIFKYLAPESVLITSEKFDVPSIPGRPENPVLVPPRDLPRRRFSVDKGHAPLIHAICHIEFNAINLALDAVARFTDMPDDFYHDWFRIAYEEATHFEMLSDHLKTMGWQYGDFDAHDGLWEMAQKTHHDVLTRMALVPRVLEARGLDVTPAMMQKLSRTGDHRAVEILEVILREEVGHVEVGTRWFNYLCEQRGLDAYETFTDLLDHYFNGEIRGPLHTEARIMAGFTEAELSWLEAQIS
jgi:uncharacterized ferritin-like protein (DUF455 family)